MPLSYFSVSTLQKSSYFITFTALQGLMVEELAQLCQFSSISNEIKGCITPGGITCNWNSCITWLWSGVPLINLPSLSVHCTCGLRGSACWPSDQNQNTNWVGGLILGSSFSWQSLHECSMHVPNFSILNTTFFFSATLNFPQSLYPFICCHVW